MKTSIFYSILILGVAIVIGTGSCKNFANHYKEDTGDNGSFTVAFYNTENLFDTKDDPKTKDDEYTPNSPKHWTEERYQTKINHLGDVFAAMDSNLPDLIGLAEIENHKVVEDLNHAVPMKGIDYEIIQKNSADQRGIDVALLYNPQKFELIKKDFIRPISFNGGAMGKRDILHAKLQTNGETIDVFVNHWPSRGGDFEEKRKKRHAVATQLKKEVDKVKSENPDANIIIMGDFNDYPTNKSIDKILEAGITKDDKLYNLMWNLEAADKGSYCYKKDWGCLDQFIVSRNFIDDNKDYVITEDDVVIFQKPWMMYTNKKGESYPSRTYSRDKYYGGYSDHLPIFMTVGWE